MKFINMIIKIISIVSTIIVTSLIIICIVDNILIELYKFNKRKNKKYNDENYLFKKRKYTTVKRREDIDYI